MLTAGRILSIIGIVLGALAVVYVILVCFAAVSIGSLGLLAE